MPDLHGFFEVPICSGVALLPLLLLRAAFHTRPLMLLRLREAASPNRPRPKIAMVAGSGTSCEALQLLEMVFVSNVTAAFNAKARPHSIFAVVFRVRLNMGFGVLNHRKVDASKGSDGGR
jgi:hypothetical protein